MNNELRIEFDEKCKACEGTGLYRGMAERDGYAVVCRKCNGTGKFHFVHDYEEFSERVTRPNVHTVIEMNPGFCVGGTQINFGGMPYEDWKSGDPFPAKSEMREQVCPQWWYQSADYDKMPRWPECNGYGGFSKCPHFKNKEECWKRFDAENAAEEEANHD